MNLLTYKAALKELAHLEDRYMISLVYISSISKASKKDRSIFNNLKESIVKSNKKYGVNGVSCNSESFFVQCVEGTKFVLLKLLADVFEDKRYKQVNVIQVKRIDRFRFNDFKAHGYCLKERRSMPFLKGKQEFASHEHLKWFMPFRPLKWQDWHIDYFVDVISNLGESVEKRKKYIKYSYHKNDLFYIYLFFVVLLLGSLVLLLMSVFT